jgi:hypothetical protein
MYCRDRGPGIANESTTPTTPTTLSSPKNDLEGDDNSFDYDAILDGDNIEWGDRSADAEQRKNNALLRSIST